MRVTQLEEMLRLLRLKKYGPQSESLADVYLPLFDEEPGVSLDEVAAEASRPPLEETPPRKKRIIPADSRCPPICSASSGSSLAPRRSANAGNAGPKRSSSATKKVNGWTSSRPSCL